MHLGYFSFCCTHTSPINPLWGFVFSVVFYIFGISIKAALKTLSKEDAQNSYCPPELQNLNFSLNTEEKKDWATQMLKFRHIEFSVP